MNRNTIEDMIASVLGSDSIQCSVKNTNEFYVVVKATHILELCEFANKTLHYPLVNLFVNDERSLNGSFRINYVFADRESGFLLIIQSSIDPNDMSIPSISEVVHSATLYEREIQDLFGIDFPGHPDDKRLVFHSNWPESVFPLRKEFETSTKPEIADIPSKFQFIKGDGVFEIPVGPVHAGIIEPGHFRFSVAGEPIIHLEAQLYYVHKGIEKLSEGLSIEKCLYMAERISGDETFTNSLAYCQAIEKIANITLPPRAQYTRVIFAELERLTSHLGDLGGVCLDTGFGFATFQYRMMRGWAYGIADLLCGMRFLRSVNQPGGVRKDFVAGKESQVIQQLRIIEKELKDTEEIIRSNTMFIDRIENTGILPFKIAKDLNAVGPGGRGSGQAADVRTSFPYEAYRAFDFKIPVYTYGDVKCRFRVKMDECLESIRIIINAIESMPDGDWLMPVPSVEPYASAFGLTESPRGENIHWVMTGEGNTIFRYKIRTPSFCNWPALCHAVKGNIVPDFPIINKSFNLSYAGNDL